MPPAKYRKALSKRDAYKVFPKSCNNPATAHPKFVINITVKNQSGIIYSFRSKSGLRLAHRLFLSIVRICMSLV